MIKPIKRSLRRLLLISILLLMSSTLVLPSCFNITVVKPTPQPSQPADSSTTASQVKTDDKEPPTVQTPQDWAQVIAKVEPSVVLILNRKFFPLRYREKDIKYCPLRYRKKLNDYYSLRWRQQYELIPTWWTGSGFIANRNGFIVTSYHAIEEAGTIYVFLNEGGEIKVSSGREYIAGLIYKDEKNDLAVIKISPGNRNLPEARLGDSSTLRVGNDIMVIGCALPYQTHKDIIAFMKQIDASADGELCSTDQVTADAYYSELEETFRGSFSSGSSTVTKGIISAMRKLEDSSVPAIQIDAAINLGDKGGPLLNKNGEVVAVASWGLKKAHPLGGEEMKQVVQQTNFAAPINEAKPMLNQAVALPSLPLISGVYCDVLQWGTYDSGPLGYPTAYSDDPTVYASAVVIKWKTDIPATSKVTYTWNPFECPDIFERAETNHNCCAKYCGGEIDPTTEFNYCYERCLRPKSGTIQDDEKLTSDHKLILTDLGLLKGSYEFRITSCSATGTAVTSDEYRFLWSGTYDKPFQSNLDHDPNPCCIPHSQK